MFTSIMHLSGLTIPLFLGLASSAVGGSLLAARNPTAFAAAHAACTILVHQLGTTIVQFNGSTGYYDATQAAWNFNNVDVDPSCVVYPRDATHVQAAMAAIYKTGSLYAVQSGGHSAMKGWNVVQDGVLILFSYMKNITYNAERNSVIFEPGPTWEEIIDAAQVYGVAAVGGRVRDVGTSLLLGGGVSYLSPEYGWASDQFKELDVVLVTGEFVTVNATNEYSDLFWALKGCANRCGIVTRYEVNAIPTGTKDQLNYYGGVITYPASSNVAIVSALATFNEAQDPHAIIIGLFLYNGDPTPTQFTSVYMFYKGSSLPESIFGELLSINATSQSLGPLSYYDLVTSIPKFPRDSIEFFGASNARRENALLQSYYQNFWNFSQSMEQYFTQGYLAYTPILDPMILAGRANGGNPMNAPLGGYITINFALQLPPGQDYVPKPLEDARLLLLEQSPPSPGIPLYIGECDLSQNVFASYNDYDRLKSVQSKYDPTGFIVKHLNGPIGL